MADVPTWMLALVRRLVLPTAWSPITRIRNSPAGMAFFSGASRPLIIQLALLSSGGLSASLRTTLRKRASSSEKIMELILAMEKNLVRTA